jgi:chemotaxis protein CheD
MANRYYDRNFQRDAVKILPGEYFATSENTMTVTVLGSCVSVCLRDPITCVAGMNHFLLPFGDSDIPTYKENPSKYGEYAIDILCEEMVKLGAVRSRLEAKVFGAGNVIDDVKLNNIAPRNAGFALKHLAEKRIPVVASDLLDSYARKIYFFPETGEVKVKKLREFNNDTILNREQMLRSKLRQVQSDD